MVVKIFTKPLKLLKFGFRFYGTGLKVQEKSRIKAWQVHSYGDITELQCGAIRLPKIQDPDQLLINVEAASINPIDLLMLGGYGRTLMQIPRKFQMELPLTLGRDFCGTVIYKGPQVGDSFHVGDQVYGFLPLYEQGSFAEVVVANKAHVAKKPEHLSTAESSSIVYTTMTAWSALYIFGNLLCKGAEGCKILILGASGGVGTAAVQLLKSQNCIVHGTCSTDALPLVQSLGADAIFDYKKSEYLNEIGNEGYYHIILDCAKFGYDNVPKNWKFGTYISLNSPLLLNTDKYGIFGGLMSSAGTLLQQNLKPPSQQKNLSWAFFVPSSSGFNFIDKLIKKGKITPLIHKEFKFENIPDAFCELQKGHMRGKIVITY